MESPGPAARAEWAALLASIKEGDPALRHRSSVNDVSLDQLYGIPVKLVKKTTKPKVTFATTPTYLSTSPTSISNEASRLENISHNSNIIREIRVTNNASESDGRSVAASTVASKGEKTAKKTYLRASRLFPPTPPDSSKEMITCCICYDTMPSSSTPTSLHSANPCDSAHFVCRGCAYMYLKTKVEEKAVGSNLTCPGNCGEVLTVEDVRSFLNSYDESNRASWYLLLRKFNEAHEAATAMESARDRRLRRWLPSATDVAADMKFAIWWCGRDARRCPGCKIVIEKNGGCQHMTCRGCRHEFWWCCGQAYRGNHNEVLCAPGTAIGFVAHHPSPYWGPNVPVRAVTKVTASCVGLGLGVTAAALSVVAVPLYLGGKILSDESGFEEWRRDRMRRHRAAAQRAATERQRQHAAVNRLGQEQRRIEDDRQLALELQDGYRFRGSHDDITISVEDVQSLDALPAFISARSCELCEMGSFRHPREMLRHLARHASGALPLPSGFIIKTAAEALRSEMSNLRSPNDCAVFAALMPAEESSAAIEVAQRELDVLYLSYLDGRHDRGAAPVANEAGQRCQCGVEPPSIQAWCAHLVSRNPEHAARVARAPAACGVIVRPGVLCDCRACEAPGVVCAGCLHPRMLHFNTARGNPRPAVQNLDDNNSMMCMDC